MDREEIIEAVRLANEQLLREYQALKPLMSIQDVARTLNVSEMTVERIVASGKLRPLWIGRQRRFDPDTVSAFLRSREGRRFHHPRRPVQKDAEPSNS